MRRHSEVAADVTADQEKQQTDKVATRSYRTLEAVYPGTCTKQSRLRNTMPLQVLSTVDFASHQE